MKKPINESGVIKQIREILHNREEFWNRELSVMSPGELPVMSPKTECGGTAAAAEPGSTESTGGGGAASSEGGGGLEWWEGGVGGSAEDVICVDDSDDPEAGEGWGSGGEGSNLGSTGFLPGSGDSTQATEGSLGGSNTDGAAGDGGGSAAGGASVVPPPNSGEAGKQSPAKQCAEIGCKVHASLGVKGSTKASFCVNHKESTMVTVFKKSCIHPNCEKFRTYGVKGDRRKFCARHKRAGMVNLSTVCKMGNCSSPKHYGKKGSWRREFCGEHKRDGMVLIGVLCKSPFGCAAEAWYGYTRRTHCTEHKDDDMKRIPPPKKSRPGPAPESPSGPLALGKVWVATCASVSDQADSRGGPWKLLVVYCLAERAFCFCTCTVSVV